jgi:hypothetical protein
VDHQRLARVSLSTLCVIQGVAQLAIDLNRTHATNPRWTGHARFHVVWQSITVGLLAGIQLILIWLRGASANQAFYIAATLVAISPLGFLAALLSRRFYGGQLSDLNGIPPLQVSIGRRVLSIDINVVAVVVALVILSAIILVYKN